MSQASQHIVRAACSRLRAEVGSGGYSRSTRQLTGWTRRGGSFPGRCPSADGLLYQPLAGPDNRLVNPAGVETFHAPPPSAG